MLLKLFTYCVPSSNRNGNRFQNVLRRGKVVNRFRIWTLSTYRWLTIKTGLFLRSFLKTLIVQELFLKPEPNICWTYVLSFLDFFGSHSTLKSQNSFERATMLVACLNKFENESSFYSFLECFLAAKPLTVTTLNWWRLYQKCHLPTAFIKIYAQLIVT